MADVTQILSQIESGDSTAADELLPLVYDELRKLAAAKLVHEKPGQTLQATALVHEAYMRLVDVEKVQKWDSRGHFFAAAAVAMQRLLVEQARRKQRLKRGGTAQRVPLDEIEVADPIPSDQLLALNEAIFKLELEAPDKAEVVQLRFFVGMTHDEVAQALGISAVTARRNWRYARAWLRHEESRTMRFSTVRTLAGWQSASGGHFASTLGKPALLTRAVKGPDDWLYVGAHFERGGGHPAVAKLAAREDAI